MIPLRDAIRSKTFPVVNILLIVANCLAFLWQLSLGPQLRETLLLYGIVPVRYSDPSLSAQYTTFEQILPFFSSMFLHGGFMHILGNMWFLYIFGDNIEDRLGHIRYLLFYLICGLSAGVIHLFTNWESDLPTIGASGAISGIMGAYLLLYPGAKILTLVPIFLFIQFFEIPAFVFLGYWFLIQLFSASLTPKNVGGIAFWAHIGGFVAGLVFIKFFDWIPRMGFGKELRHYTERKRTPRLQTLSPLSFSEDPNLYGEIYITPKEALYGTRKLIAVPQGLKKRNVLVTIPPDVRDGTKLRLKGLGRMDRDGDRGDLFLEIRVLD